MNIYTSMPDTFNKIIDELIECDKATYSNSEVQARVKAHEYAIKYSAYHKSSNIQLELELECANELKKEALLSPSGTPDSFLY